MYIILLISLGTDWLIAATACYSFSSMRRLGVFLLSLDGMAVHHRSLPRNLLGFPNNFVSIHLYTWVERGTVRVKCLAQEHNTMSPARARTQTDHSGDELTNQYLPDMTLRNTVILQQFGHTDSNLNLVKINLCSTETSSLTISDFSRIEGYV